MKMSNRQPWVGRRWEIVWGVLGGMMIMGLSVGAREPAGKGAAIEDPVGNQKSQVYDVYGEWSVRGMEVHNASVKLMLDTGVKRLAGMSEAGEAWRSFLHEEDVIALVFSPMGEELGVNRGVAKALLLCLYEAGFAREKIMIVGLADLPDEAEGTRLWRYGWQDEPVDFVSASDSLASWLEEVTAIINIPSIMDDNILGVRGALANLSFGVIKSPAKLYMCHGDPFVPEIYRLAEIRGKVRLHIAVGLRVLYYGGPEVRQMYVNEHKTLLFSLDPVALDRVAQEIIIRARRTLPLREGVEEEVSVRYLETAQAMGLGYNDLNYIDYQRIQNDKLK